MSSVFKNCRLVKGTRIHPYTLTFTPLPQTSTSTTTTLIPTLIPTTMALMKEEWTTRASKYRYGINADKASKDKLVEFIQTTIYLYNEQDLTKTDF